MFAHVYLVEGQAIKVMAFNRVYISLNKLINTLYGRIQIFINEYDVFFQSKISILMDILKI